MVTRDIDTTAQLTRRILVGDMHYDLDYTRQQYNIILRERLTGSPVRIVTADDMLTTAFWDSYLRDEPL